jgi:hypothetical protein
MKKLNPIYLWYSIILLFPPVHEWGHVIIAWLTGSRVLAMNFLSVRMTKTSPLQEWWQHSIWIPVGCSILFLIIVLKTRVIITNKSFITKKVLNETQ